MKIIFSVLVFSSMVSFGQQLTNSNFGTWVTESYGIEPGAWQFDDGTGLVYGTYNYFKSYDGTDPLTTTKITGTSAYGGTGNSVLLETKSVVGPTLINMGFTTIPGYLYRQEPILNTNIGSITFNYKCTVVQGDSCFVKIGLIGNNNTYSSGIFWIKPSNNSTNWKTKTIILNNLLPGTPTEIFVEAMSTFDTSYTLNTPIIGSKLYLDNFTLNYCTSTTTNINETICDYMLPYTWNGVTFTSAGNQSAPLTSSLGCDSIVNMSLTVVGGPYTQIPDPVFEQKLIDLGYDMCGIIDGKVPTNNISNVLSLSLNGLSITNMTGIEDFTSLETLSLSPYFNGMSQSGPNLSSNGLDLSSNTALKHLTCESCYLQNINLSNNINLVSLDLGSYAVSFGGLTTFSNSNNISTIDLSTNNSLQFVDIDRVKVNNLTLPVNDVLKRLLVNNNNLVSLIGNNNSQLKNLNCSFNSSLISLPLNAPNLDTLNVSNCGFSGLNLNNQTSLNWLDCSSNNLSCLSLKNNANNQLSYINTENNFSLTCIEVDDSIYSTNNPIWNANKDTWSSYNFDCPGFCFTANLEEVLAEKIVMYPNPTEGIVNIKSSNSIEKIVITNIEGRILDVFEQCNSINIYSFESGIYNVIIYFTNGNYSTKSIIKQ
jgi:hypothetical protein